MLFTQYSIPTVLALVSLLDSQVLANPSASAAHLQAREAYPEAYAEAYAEHVYAREAYPEEYALYSRSAYAQPDPLFGIGLHPLRAIKAMFVNKGSHHRNSESQMQRRDAYADAEEHDLYARDADAEADALFGIGLHPFRAVKAMFVNKGSYHRNPESQMQRRDAEAEAEEYDLYARDAEADADAEAEARIRIGLHPFRAVKALFVNKGSNRQQGGNPEPQMQQRDAYADAEAEAEEYDLYARDAEADAEAEADADARIRIGLHPFRAAKALFVNKGSSHHHGGYSHSNHPQGASPEPQMQTRDAEAEAEEFDLYTRDPELDIGY